MPVDTINGHTIEHEDEERGIYRCVDCGLTQSTTGAYEIYRCNPNKFSVDIEEEEQ